MNLDKFIKDYNPTEETIGDLEDLDKDQTEAKRLSERGYLSEYQLKKVYKSIEYRVFKIFECEEIKIIVAKQWEEKEKQENMKKNSRKKSTKKKKVKSH